jgi:hypothetical protein
VDERELVAQLRVLGAELLVLLERATQPCADRLLACPRVPGRPGRGAVLLVAELLDRGAQLRVTVEVAGADARLGGDGQERDRLPAPVEFRDRALSALLSGDRPSARRRRCAALWIVECSRALARALGVAPA